MSNDALVDRLAQAQEAISAALDAGRTEALPDLVSGRDADIRELALRVQEDAALRRWAARYLERDRQILSTVSTARDAAAARLLLLHRGKAAKRSYISCGLRR